MGPAPPRTAGNRRGGPGSAAGSTAESCRQRGRSGELHPARVSGGDPRPALAPGPARPLRLGGSRWELRADPAVGAPREVPSRRGRAALPGPRGCLPGRGEADKAEGKCRGCLLRD